MLPTARGMDDQEIVRREDSSWLVDGGVAMEQVRHCSPCAANCPASGPAPLPHPGRLCHPRARSHPQEGDHFEKQGFRFEVVDMDNTRIGRVLIAPVTPATDPAATQ